MLIKKILTNFEKNMTEEFENISLKKPNSIISVKWTPLESLIKDDKILVITYQNSGDDFFITKSRLFGFCINKCQGDVKQCANSIVNQIEQIIMNKNRHSTIYKLNMDRDKYREMMHLMKEDSAILSSFISPVIHVNLPNSDKDILKDASEAFDNIFDAIER